VAHSIRAQSEAGVCVIGLRGDIDAAAVDQLASTLASAVGAGPPDGRVIVDLAGANFLDSRSIGVLADWQTRLRAAGGRLALVGTRPEVVRLFEMIGLAEAFEFYADVDQARAGTNTQDP
jgi:anti-sigma B factor antagonist